MLGELEGIDEVAPEDLTLLRIAVERLCLHFVGSPPEQWPVELEAARGEGDELKGQVVDRHTPGTVLPESPSFYAEAEAAREELLGRLSREPSELEVVQRMRERAQGSLAGEGEGEEGR